MNRERAVFTSQTSVLWIVAFMVTVGVQAGVPDVEPLTTQVHQIPPGLEVQHHFFNPASGELLSDDAALEALGAVGVAAGDKGDPVYACTPPIDQLFTPGADRLTADDITTVAIGGCDLEAFELVVGGGGDGSGPGFSFEFALYSECPLDGVEPIPGTVGNLSFDDDGLHQVLIDFHDNPIPTNKSYYVGLSFDSDDAGWLAGVPAATGFTENQFHYPLFPCRAHFPLESLYAGFYYVADCGPTEREFLAYRDANIFGERLDLGHDNWIVDDIQLIGGIENDTCFLSSYDVAGVGTGTPFNPVPFTITAELRTSCEPETVIEGTQRTFNAVGDGLAEVAQFEFAEPVPLPPGQDFFLAFRYSAPANVIVAGDPDLGFTLDTFTFEDLCDDGMGGQIPCHQCQFSFGQEAVGFFANIRCLGEAPMGACCDLAMLSPGGGDSEADLCRNVKEIDCTGPLTRFQPGAKCPGTCSDSFDRCQTDTDCPNAQTCEVGSPFDPPCGSHACCSWDGTCEDLGTDECMGPHHEWHPGEFCSSMPCAHVSDECTDALALEVVDECPDNATLCLALSNAEATSNANDPDYCCYADSVDAAGDRTIWFSFEATATSARIDTCGTAGDFGGDSLLQLFEAGDPSTPEAACATLIPLACSDNAAACGIDGRGSRIDASGLIAGSTYYIELASKTSDDAGVYTLSVALPSPAPEPPTNDDCEGALPIDIDTWSFDLEGATSACPIEPCSQEMEGDVWFEYTASQDGVHSIDACLADSGLPHAITLAIYEGDGCALDAETRIACQNSSDGICPTGVLAYFFAETGFTYKIRVGSDFSGVIDGSLTLAPVIDCQPNGIPDVCDLDCGVAGGPCDIPYCGQSGDTDLDGVPDECTQSMRTFVDAAATGANDGSSWEDAFVDLQDALDAVGGLDCCTAGGCAIWVAPGVYKPDRGTGDRFASFYLLNCVTLRAVSLVQETVLSGDLLGNDGPGFTNYGDNSYSVVDDDFPGADATIVIDGFTITAGSGSGGGMFVSGSPTVRNCTFRANSSDTDGAGMYSQGAGPRLTDCTFENNQTEGSGGGFHSEWGDPILEGCVFRNNSAVDGAGMYSAHGNPVLTGCVFENNTATSSGGGLYIEGGQLNLTDCVFRNNSADRGGGVLLGSGTVTDCVFTGNSAMDGGGLLSGGFGGDVAVKRCAFDQNTARNGGGMWGEGVLTTCTFSRNTALITGNPGELGGGLYGGGTLTNCVFRNNEARVGGGVCTPFDHGPWRQHSFTNCVLSANSAEYGGGMYATAWHPVRLVNCTLNDNTAVSANGIGCLLFPGCSVDLSNVILANGGDELSPWASAVVTHSCIQDEDPDDDEVFPGEGNIDDDPLFENVDGPDGIPGTEDDQLHLLPGSPCINAGTNSTPLELPLTDLDGNPRVRDCRVDMGVYEAPATAPSVSAPPGTIFVMEGASNENGLTWESAYRYLQDALAAVSASDGSISEIWVAAGTYKPDQGEQQVAGDRSATFELVNGVAVYGGFACGDSAFAMRDPARNASILSGDLNRDDGPTLINMMAHCFSGSGIPAMPGCEDLDQNGDGDVDGNDIPSLLWENNYAENSYHVVSADLVDGTAVLDGVTITGGNADENGGDQTGGGMICDGGSPTVVDCKFVGNTAENGAGVVATEGATPTFVGCTFDGNWASESGGGMYNFSSSPNVTNCAFDSNAAADAGGGMLNYNDSSPLVTSCTFSGNAAGNGGGAMYSADGPDAPTTPVLNNCILWGNAPEQIVDAGVAVTSITYSDVQGLWPGAGNIDIDPHFVPGPGGCLYLSQVTAGQDVDSLCIDAGSDTAANLGLDVFTTSSDEGTDAGIVDMGYHYTVTGQLLVMGDYDRNQFVNLADFAEWESCMTGPGDVSVSPCCRIFDFELDGDVDLDDYVAFEVVFSSW